MTTTGRERLELAALLAIGIAPFYLNGFYNSPLASSHRELFWVVEVGTWILMPLVLLLAGRRRGLYTAEDLGLMTAVRGHGRGWAVWPLMAIVPLAMWKLDVVVAIWGHRGLPPGWSLPPFHYADVVPPPGPETGWWRLLALSHLCLTAGFVEELYYRAAFDRLFPRGWLAGFAYILVSSLVFACAHWEGGLPNLAEAFAVGVFAAAVFRATRNVWPLIVGHVVTDWYWISGA
jgi:hypothetical protein